VTGKFPLIGSDFLFSSGAVRLSASGLEFNPSYEPANADHCAGLTLDFSGNTLESPVKSVRITLVIDGREQSAFLDTGRRETLAGTAAAPAPGRRSLPKFDVRFNSLGEWKFAPYRSRTATLAIGRSDLTVGYQHFTTDESVAAPFVLGAGILKHYSLVIDPAKGRACFFRA
jgi:hypothetical protein